MARKKSKPVVGLRNRAKSGVRPHGILAPRAVKHIEQRYQIVQLRRDGFTIREIAQTLGIDDSTVCNQLKKALEYAVSQTNETTEESRQLQVERLDLLLKTYKPFATEWHKEERVDPASNARVIIEVPPDPKYANLILQIEMRRSKLLALDVPETKKLDVTGIREYTGVDMDKV
jgi:uncharacterized protein YerC